MSGLIFNVEELSLNQIDLYKMVVELDDRVKKMEKLNKEKDRKIIELEKKLTKKK